MVLLAVLAAVVAAFFATAAQAGGGTVSWTGSGADSIGACTNGQSSYLHWIFSEGGDGSVSSATLTLGGTGSGQYTMSQHGNSWTVDTGYYALSGLTAHATYTGDLGNGSGNLVISGGCYDETTVPTGGVAGSILLAGLVGLGLGGLQLRRRRRNAAA